MDGSQLTSCVHLKVTFGGEVINLGEKEEPISLETFQVLIEEEEEEEEDRKPYYLFAFVHSSAKNCSYKHLYSAENIVHWYPLEGTTDPCTRGEIEKIEYYFYVKGQMNAIHMGDVHPHSEEDGRGKDQKKDETRFDTLRTDLLVWSITAKDEPSRLLSLLAIAYLYNCGLCTISKPLDKLDTSHILHTSNFYYSERQEGKQIQEHNIRQSDKEEDQRISHDIYEYIVNRLSREIRIGKIVCSDMTALMSSLKHDSAKHVAQNLVKLDPTIGEENDDFSKRPHIRTNALTVAIQAIFP